MDAGLGLMPDLVTQYRHFCGEGSSKYENGERKT